MAADDGRLMRVLLVVHGFPPAASGGTELYVADFAHALAGVPGLAVSVLTREADASRPEYSVQVRTTAGGVRVFGINNTFQACTSFEESYTNPTLAATAREILDDVDPDVVHVQHLTCLSTDILRQTKAPGRRECAVVMTLNDYWLMCHRGQLLRPDGARCDGPFEGGCDACIPAAMLAAPAAYRMGRLARAAPLPGAGIAVRAAEKTLRAIARPAAARDASSVRLQHLRAAAAAVDMFLAPSATMEAWALRFGIARSRLERCDQGIDLTGFAAQPRVTSDTLRLAFAGSLIPSKAPHLLLEAAAALPAGRVTVDLLGAATPFHGDARYDEQLAPLLGQPFVRKRGPVPRHRVPGAFGDVDVLVVPSIWIENAPFVIREAFAAGVPVIASNLGGMAEMVTHERDGLLFTVGDAADLTRQIRRLLEEPGLLPRLRLGIRRAMSIEQDAAGMVGRYQRLVSPRPAVPRIPVSRPETGGPAVRAVVLNFRTPDQTWLAARSIASSTIAVPTIVVDNDSSDGSLARLSESLPAAEVVATNANLGFSGGCNVGIRKALAEGAELVLLVNSDVVLEPHAIERLVAAARAHPDGGVFAPVLLSREEPDRIASAGIRYAPATGRMRQIAAGQPVSMLPAVSVRRVDAASGCVMLVRREVFARAGLLDEPFFFSFEDIEFCLRARRHGFETFCVQNAIAYHEGGRSIGRTSPNRLYYAARNHL
ncbi:MAG TPA: glycosyltransferase, partial [Vicinamibacterales bacterium]|nr:glycosyltransferase [Vicinamibacterales bacterium]